MMTHPVDPEPDLDDLTLLRIASRRLQQTPQHRAHDFVLWSCKRLTAPLGVSAIESLEADIGVKRAAPFRKAVVPGLTAATSGLVDAQLGAALVETFRSDRLLPRLPGAIPAPLNVRLAVDESDITAAFVGEGEPVPCAALAFDTVTLTATKTAIIVPFSKELVELGAVPAITSRLRPALVKAENTSFLGTQAATPYGEPEGLLRDVVSSGTTAVATFATDVLTLFSAVRGGAPRRPTFISSAKGALWLGSLNSSGTPRFADVLATTGASWLIVPEAASRLILLDSTTVIMADLGLTLDKAEAGALQGVDNPVNSAATGTPAAMYSLFQTGTIAIKAQMWSTWAFAVAPADGRAAFLDLPVA